MEQNRFLPSRAILYMTQQLQENYLAFQLELYLSLLTLGFHVHLQEVITHQVRDEASLSNFLCLHLLSAPWGF